MKIIIIGCGNVGYALAEGLTQENHDVTIIDSSADRLQNATEELDVMPIVLVDFANSDKDDFNARINDKLYDYNVQLVADLLA